MGFFNNITNATKGLVIAFIDSCLGVAMVFGVGLDTAQHGAIMLLANTALALWIALTYKESPTRVSKSRAGEVKKIGL